MLQNVPWWFWRNWEQRTNHEDRAQILQIVSAKNLQDQQKLESKLATPFSAIAFPSYYDAIRMTVIDPMHNLFHGTAKHFLKIWKNLGYLNKDKLDLMQEKTDQFVVPHNIGKIPRKTSSCFDGFDADEYKNWVMLFSIHMLDDVIPKRHKECFRKFVFACQYICKRIISENDITIAHGLLIQFFKDFEILYVKEKVTSNMHLHLHLKDFLLDFGPIYSFWLFSFERYNEMLGNLPNSKRNIELQIMRRFCTENIIMK